MNTHADQVMDVLNEQIGDMLSTARAARGDKFALCVALMYETFSLTALVAVATASKGDERQRYQDASAHLGGSIVELLRPISGLGDLFDEARDLAIQMSRKQCDAQSALLGAQG